MRELKRLLIDNEAFKHADKFKLLSDVNDIEDEANFRDMSILIAMRLDKDEWGVYSEIASSLVRKSGLFLYLNSEQSSAKDTLAQELHRSPSGRDAFMHRAQYQVLSRLLAGESIILSAPTSFGKSFIIDELILSGNYSNILIVVPTIALIDEVRRRVLKFDANLNVICFKNQTPKAKNVYVLTQERALEMQDTIQTLDLLIIDEFYKMDSSIGHDSSDRASLLNVCYRLYEARAKQVYLLGPYISKVAGYENSTHQPEVVICNDNTTYIEYVKLTGDRNEALENVIERESSNVMVYCNSPAEISKVYRHLASNIDTYALDKANVDFADWINENVCRDWYVTEALTVGIGIHHAQMPRFVAQEMIRRFNEGKIKVLLCTSTIIEGVNTAAKAVVIYSKKRGTHNIDEFTFKNIAGRAGRTFQHFSGRVYYFDTLKSTEEITVTDQIGNDNDTVEPNILSLLDQKGLTDKQSSKLTEYHESSTLPVELLKANYFIPLNLQEETIEWIESQSARRALPMIKETHLTSWQIRIILQGLAKLGLSFQSIGRAKTEENGIIRTSIFINAFMNGGIEELAKSASADHMLSDQNIEFAFDFIRNVMTYRLPRYIRALDRLQKHALTQYGNLEPFATTLEFMNLPAVYVQLDELGLPVSISQKLNLPTDSLEETLQYIKTPQDFGELSSFERQIYNNFIAST